MRINHYQILGIQDDAPVAKVKAAYRAESIKWHPDKAKVWADEREAECSEVFKKLSEAHETLSDPAKRQAYDRFLSMTQHSLDTPEEAAFYKQWMELKSLYETYEKREANPKAFIAYLKEQLAKQEKRNAEQANRSEVLAHNVQKLYEENLRLKADLKLAQSEASKNRQALTTQQERYEKLVTATLSDEPAELKQSKQTLFAPAPTVTAAGKIIPKGLFAFYNIILEMEGEKVFLRVKLQFHGPDSASAFQQALIAYEKIPGSVVNIYAVAENEVGLLNITFKNCASDREAADNFRRTGALLLNELEKVVDISQMKPVFVDRKFKPVSAEVLQQLADNYKRSVKKR
jgi:hypothetical protein